MSESKRSSICLVEDEVIIAMSMEIQLKEAGYNVIKRVTTGEEAVRAVETLHPDIVLMDIHLAGKVDGIEAARRIRKVYKTSIIFMTGYPNKELREQASRVQPLAYLIKPIDMDSLFSIIDSAADTVRQPIFNE